MINNNKIKKICLSAICVLALAGFEASAKKMDRGSNFNSNNSTVDSQRGMGRGNTSTVTALTSEQIDDLVFMYQEEKVARDVYTKLYEKWGVRVFNNISRSEQSHMNAVEKLLVKYDIPIPITAENVGDFVLPELQYYYDTLMEKGLKSKIDAFEVGVKIEEHDIIDIEEKIVGAPADIERVFGNLLKGSYNHLAAFNRQLNK